LKKTELACEDGKIVIKMSCSECNTAKTVPVPEDVVKMMRECGASDNEIARAYKEYCLDNCHYSSFCTFRCRLCGEGRVLAWEAGNSPASHEVISPSREIEFWPNYDYPSHKIRICKECLPDNDNKESRDSFLKKLFVAMQKEEDDNWTWKSKNKIKI